MKSNLIANLRNFVVLVGIMMPVAALAHPALNSFDDAGCLKCHQSVSQYKVAHPALKMGCSACHKGTMTDGKTAFALIAKGDDLCFSCHPDKKDLLKKSVMHPAFKEMGCTSCHNPHGSSVAKLLTEKIPGLCLNCHDNKKIDEKAVTKHMPFVDGDCLACHNPHASEQAGLLVKPLKEVCLSCHEKKDFRRHPVPFHPLEGVPDNLREGKDLSCVSCHNPHQSGFKKLFYTTSNRTQVCIDCHSKGKNAIH